MEKDYEVEIEIKFTCYVDVEGNSIFDAERKAKEEVKELYRLNSTGMLHIRENVKYDVFASEIDV